MIHATLAPVVAYSLGQGDLRTGDRERGSLLPDMNELRNEPELGWPPCDLGRSLRRSRRSLRRVFCSLKPGKAFRSSDLGFFHVCLGASGINPPAIMCSILLPTQARALEGGDRGATLHSACRTSHLPGSVDVAAIAVLASQEMTVVLPSWGL